MAPESSLKELNESVAAAFAAQSSGSDPGSDHSVSLLDLLIVLAERKRTILWVTVSFVIVALIVSMLLPARYTATVVLLPPQQNSSMGSALASQLGSLGGMAALAGSSLGIKNPNDMYVAMFRGRTVEEAMIRDFSLMQEYHDRYLSDARKDFERRATVDGSGKDGLIHISVEDHDPRRAAELANGYVDRYRHLSEHLAITEASQRRLFFEQQLEQAKDKLADAEEALTQTEQKTGLIQLDSQTRAVIESAASLRAQIAAQEVQIQGIQTYATSQNSQLVEAEQELDGLRAQLAKLGGTESGIGELSVPKGLVPETGLEYVRKLRDVKYYETIFDILARQFEIAKLDEAKQGALIQVVDSAVPPDKKSFPRRGLIVLGAAVLGLMIAVCMVLVGEAMERLHSAPAAHARLFHLRRALAWKARSAS